MIIIVFSGIFSVFAIKGKDTKLFALYITFNFSFKNLLNSITVLELIIFLKPFSKTSSVEIIFVSRAFTMVGEIVEEIKF